MIRDLTDEEARRALILKWGMTEAGVIPAWVAEMDYATADVVTQALVEAVQRGQAGYPPYEFGGELGRSYAVFEAGARTLILTQAHNPWGRVFTRAELEAIRDVVVRRPRRCAGRLGQGVQHRGPQVRAARDRRRRDPRPAVRCADGPLRLLVHARCRGRDCGVRPGRSVAGGPHPAPRPATDPPPPARLWSPRSRTGLPRARTGAAGSRSRLPPGATGHVRLNIATAPERLTEIVHRMATALAT